MTHLTALLFGLGNGGVYAALAIALVLTYRSSGVLNFATGSIALYSAYTYASLREGSLVILIPGFPKSVGVGGSMAFVPAALISLAVAAVLGVLMHFIVFRPLRQAPPLAKAVASLGVLVVIRGLTINRVGTSPVSVSPIFPADRWHWGSLTLLSDRFYVAVSVVGLTLALTAAYRWTRFGLVTRAVSESHTGGIVSGVSPERVALFNWIASAVVAGAAGILIAPISTLTPDAYTLAVVPALAAAVVGGFEFLVPTAAAGILIGMLQSESSTLAAQHSWFPQSGSAELVPLVVVVVALLVTGRGMPVRGAVVRQRMGRAPRPRSLLWPTVVGTAMGVVALLVTEGSWRSAVIGTFIAGILGLSYVVVTGYAGQVSLAQLTLAGVGGFALSGITHSWGLPFPLAPIAAALITTVVGVVVGLPALRLRGLTLGIVTLALAYAIEALWFRNSQFVKPAGASVKSPHLFGINLGIGTGAAFPRMSFGLLCLVTLVIVAVGVAKLRQSALGSAMLAVRANERSAAGIGVNVVGVKIAAFALSSFIAGIGGSLFAYRQGVVTFNSFTAIGGLALLSTAYLAGITSVSGGIVAGVIASSGIFYFAMDRWVHLGKWFDVLSGVGVILMIIQYPEGIAGAGQRGVQRLRRMIGRRAPARSAPASAPAPAPSPVRRPVTAGAPVLDVAGLTVRYGGVTAVSDVTLSVPAGTVVGLIGPNGAGKTSLIDAITGFAAAEGSVRLNGERIDQLSAHRRVRRGLGRTFQALELYEDLTVDENINAAVLGASVGDRQAHVANALRLTGIDDIRDRHAEDLSQGERQLVSIARACVSSPSVLLLDEPAAGLDQADTKRLGERIRAIADTGAGVLLVDHDIGLVLSVCEHIYVLDFGQLIMEGDAATIRADRGLAEAYLGTLHEAVLT